MYPGYMNNLTNRVYTECDTWRSAMFDRVNALKPDVVIVTSQTRVVAVEPSGMAKTVTNLSASGARVIYLEDTPYPGTTVGAVPGLSGRPSGRHPTVQPGSGRPTEPAGNHDAADHRDQCRQGRWGHPVGPHGMVLHGHHLPGGDRQHRGVFGHQPHHRDLHLVAGTGIQCSFGEDY